MEERRLEIRSISARDKMESIRTTRAGSRSVTSSSKLFNLTSIHKLLISSSAQTHAVLDFAGLS